MLEMPGMQILEALAFCIYSSSMMLSEPSGPNPLYYSSNPPQPEASMPTEAHVSAGAFNDSSVHHMCCSQGKL